MPGHAWQGRASNLPPYTFCMTAQRDDAAVLPGLERPVLGPTGRPVTDFPTPPPLRGHGPARIISLCNQKGGVGKTTSTVNVAAAMAQARPSGEKPLESDLDPSTRGAMIRGCSWESVSPS